MARGKRTRGERRAVCHLKGEYSSDGSSAVYTARREDGRKASKAVPLAVPRPELAGWTFYRDESRMERGAPERVVLETTGRKAAQTIRTLAVEHLAESQWGLGTYRSTDLDGTRLAKRDWFHLPDGDGIRRLWFNGDPDEVMPLVDALIGVGLVSRAYLVRDGVPGNASMAYRRSCDSFPYREAERRWLERLQGAEK